MPDSETLRFGPGAVNESSRAVIFPVSVGQIVFLLRASLLDEEVPSSVSMGVLKQLGSVIDVAEKTINFETFEKKKVPREVVAGHLTGSPVEARFCTSETLDATDVGTGTSGTGGYHSSTVFRKGWFGLSINHTSCCHDCYTVR